MVAYTKPLQRKREESEELRGERDQIKFIDLRFERWYARILHGSRRKSPNIPHLNRIKSGQEYAGSPKSLPFFKNCLLFFTPDVFEFSLSFKRFQVNNQTL